MSQSPAAPTLARGVQRGLEFARYGRAQGRPVLLHHGLMGSVELDPSWAVMAEREGFEILTVARPGYGKSAPVDMRSIGEWPALVMPLLEDFGWARFDSVGISAGAPYALSLAAAFPERVAHVGVLSGVPRVCDAAILALYSEHARAAYERYRVGAPEAVAQEFRGSFEQALTRVPEGHPWRASVVATLAHDGAGPGREARLQIQPWGFSFEDIRVPVGVWHAREDDMVPFAAAEASQRKLKTATLYIQQAPQHVPSDETGRALFRFLAGATKD